MGINNFGENGLLLETGTNELQLVEFILRGQSFGCNVDKILQIINKPKITVVPKSPESIAGVFEYRDKTIPLIDLRECLKFKESKIKNGKSIDQKIIVTDFNKIYNGFLVDDVERLHRVSWEDIEPPVIISNNGEDSYLVGMINIEDNICSLVDFEKIISTMNPEIAIGHNVNLSFEKKRKEINILYAEDSQFVRNDVFTLLTNAGYNVTAVENGYKALMVLRDCEKKCAEGNFPINKFFNIVITDIEMPKMDGRHLTKKIKNSSILKKLPVFLFTSMSGMWSDMKAETIGADAIFGKPDLTKVMDNIEKHILPPYEDN